MSVFIGRVANSYVMFIFAGKQTVNSLFGTRVAVLVGDFLFAQSSWFLAQLENLEVSMVQHNLQLCSRPGFVAGIVAAAVT